MKSDEKQVLSEMVRTAFVKYLADYLGEDQVEAHKTLVRLGSGRGIVYDLFNIDLTISPGHVSVPTWLNPKHYLVLTEVQMSAVLHSAKTLGIRKDFAIRLMGTNIVRQVKYAARRYARLIKSINES